WHSSTRRAPAASWSSWCSSRRPGSRSLSLAELDPAAGLAGRYRTRWIPSWRDLLILEVADLTVEVAGAPILSGASFRLASGDKAGLVGRNGAGKTSLLGVLSGSAEPAAGSVALRGAMGYLPQDPGLRHLDPLLTALRHVLS